MTALETKLLNRLKTLKVVAIDWLEGCRAARYQLYGPHDAVDYKAGRDAIGDLATIAEAEAKEGGEARGREGGKPWLAK